MKTSVCLKYFVNDYRHIFLVLLYICNWSTLIKLKIIIVIQLYHVTALQFVALGTACCSYQTNVKARRRHTQWL